MNNVHRSEQRIDFGAGDVKVFSGWYLSGVGAELSVHPFHQGERDAFTALVGRAMADPTTDHEDHERAAAYLAFANWGDHEEDKDWGRECLYKYFEDYAPDLEAIDFCPGIAPPSPQPPDTGTQAYTVRVAWMAEAEIEVRAKGPREAEQIARESGLPWSKAVEGAAGALTLFEVVDPHVEHEKKTIKRLMGPEPRATEIPAPRELATLGQGARER
jgi:hypothetical protein